MDATWDGNVSRTPWGGGGGGLNASYMYLYQIFALDSDVGVAQNGNLAWRLPNIIEKQSNQINTL